MQQGQFNTRGLNPSTRKCFASASCSSLHHPTHPPTHHGISTSTRPSHPSHHTHSTHTPTDGDGRRQEAMAAANAAPLGRNNNSGTAAATGRSQHSAAAAVTPSVRPAPVSVGLREPGPGSRRVQGWRTAHVVYLRGASKVAGIMSPAPRVEALNRSSRVWHGATGTGP
jgi:hypothetical protein